MESRNLWLKELGCNEQLWAKELEDVPSMIKYSYTQLSSLTKEGQVYGVMLQCKDLYETLYKIPIIMTLIIIDSDAKYKEGSAYTDILKASLSSPMSMGLWDALASVIVKKDKELHLPSGLVNIIKRTRKLYATEVTSDVPDVINWRNDTIGHGALKFEDDESYKQEVKSLILMLREYFDGDGQYSIKGLYASAYFEICGKRLVGNNAIMPYDESNLKLVVDSVEYEAEYYVNTHNLKYYLFDSYYCRKNLIKYSSYIDGKSELLKSKYFADLYEKYVLKSGRDFHLQSEFISREEDMILEYLNTPLAYIKPVHLVEKLTETMDEIGHGIITVFMERGTGKSAFSNQMSGLYHKTPLLKKSLSRCYHVQNASLRGMGDFINSVNFNFRHSFDPTKDLYGSTDEIPSLTNDTESPAYDMASFLNYYHERYRKEYTILLIDGIDEITEPTQRILDFLPAADQLDDGVFIILLSRFMNEDTVLGNSKKYIEIAENISQKQICVNRKDEENVRMLKECISQQIKAGKYPDNVNSDELIKRADYRFLYLKAYLATKVETILDNKNEYFFISSYINYILSFYAPSQKHRIKEIAVTIALFPSVSIQKYKEYMNCDITYEFIGLLNDLLPVMTVLHINGEDIYAFADAAYVEYVLNEFSDVTEEVIDSFYESMRNNLDSYLSRGSIVRIDDCFRNEPEEKINNSIIFFSEGIIELWNKSISDKVIRNKFFSMLGGIIICGNLDYDPWAKAGYGFYLKNELANCMGAALYYCVQNCNDKVASAWSKRICQKFNNRHRGDVTAFSGLESAIIHSYDFGNIFDYIVENSELIKVNVWFWVLETKATDDVIEVLKSQEGLMDAFIDYLFGRNGYIEQRWLDKFYATELTPTQEGHILNLQLRHYLSCNYLSCSMMQYDKVNHERAKECLKKIRSKGYTIEEHTFFDDFSDTVINVDKMINSIESCNLQKEQFEEKKKDAISTLLEFSIPWTIYNNNIESVSNALSAIKYWDEEEELEQGDVNELYTAFFKRMCFEYESGSIEIFLESEIELADFIVDILKNEFGCEQSYFINLNKWINIVRSIISKRNKRAIRVLSKMMIEGVNWLITHKKYEEAEIMLEDYIYNIDTQAFFASYFVDRMSSAVEPDIIYRSVPMVYCTDNAIYLLDYYMNKGSNKKFDLLMNQMENDIPIIDKYHIPNRETQALCEIVIFKFMKYRQSVGYTSKFDEYFNNVIKEHFSFIDNQLQSLSRNSDYNKIAFHIELLMEYAWQTQDWSMGKTMCNELIDIFEAHESYDDMVVKQSLERQLKVLKQCQQFFLFINCESFSNIEKSGYIHMDSAYCFFTRRTLYTTVNEFGRMSEQTRKPDEYIDNDSIALEVYSKW